MRSQQDIDNIIQEVQTKLDAYQKRTGISLRVPKDGYIQDDPWLNVVVDHEARQKKLNKVLKKSLTADEFDRVGPIATLTPEELHVKIS